MTQTKFNLFHQKSNMKYVYSIGLQIPIRRRYVWLWILQGTVSFKQNEI